MIILLEHDLDAAVAFYQLLGLKLVFRMKDKWAEFSCGDIKLGLCPTTEESTIVHHSGIVLEVPDLPAFYKDHKEEFSCLGELIEKPHGIMLTIKDPGNNTIDLYQPTPEKLKELIKQAKAQPEQDGCCKADENMVAQDSCCKAEDQSNASGCC